MKKLMLTALTAAMMGITCVAQEQQDTTRTQSNQYRNNTTSDSTQQVEQGKKSTRIYMEADNSDSVERERPLTSGEASGNEVYQQGERDSTAADTKIKVDSASHENDKQSGESSTESKSVQSNDQRTQSAEGNEVRSNERMGSGSGTAVNNLPQHDVEVVPNKEGPNNEVVYKYQGEMYYVNREKKELVKVKDADLRDAKTELMIHEGPLTKDAKNTHRKSIKG